MSNTTVKIHGLERFKAELSAMPGNLQKREIRKLMREAMTVVRQDARANAPKLAQPVLKNGVPVRLPGTLQKAISVRTSKEEDKAGNVGMFVNVRPLKGNTYRGRGASRQLVSKSQRSAENPRDPYYWRWIEFGTRGRSSVRGKFAKDHNGGKHWTPSGKGANRGAVRPYGFLRKAANSLQLAVDKFVASMADWSRKANTTGRLD